MSALTTRHFLCLLTSLIVFGRHCEAQQTALPQWKTAFYKRGFVGHYEAKWAGGAGATLRSRVPMPFAGSQVRITIAPMRTEETRVSKISLAPGADKAGKATGTPTAITFARSPGWTLVPNQTEVVSDATDVAITRGDWYLQSSYASEKLLYANNVDDYFNEAGDRHDAATLNDAQKGTWPGNVYRVEVLTSDTRPIVLCYGDSITHGFGSTPNTGKAYPEVLGQLTGLPTLNLGVNGDMVSYVGGAPILIRTCNGVRSVVVVMGINDIISGKITSVDEYAKVVSGFISTIKQDGKKIYWGTITPSGGYAKFDADAAKETLRQGINQWIRTQSGADGVIDFDAALADPNNPSKIRAEYQNDWLHPNDAGYQKMAETAAAVIQKP